LDENQAVLPKKTGNSLYTWDLKYVYQEISSSGQFAGYWDRKFQVSPRNERANLLGKL
jgi:hypothetical protein